MVLWPRIQCPTLLVSRSESFLRDPATAGVISHFKQAELARIEGAGHRLHQDKADEVLDILQVFLENRDDKASIA
jgi:pimeloyl-ACP methyl ester carboxylesterase